MTSLEKALQAITSFLDAQRTPYMVIGGIANIIWGTPRATVDIDITLQVPDSERFGFFTEIARHFDLRTKEPETFVRDTRVLPVNTAEGICIDLMFALLPFEEHAIRRAVRKQLGEVSMNVCTAEDLIVHKIISDRPQDKADVLAIIDRRRQQLDRHYLDPIVAAIARELDKPEIHDLYVRAVGPTE